VLVVASRNQIVAPSHFTGAIDVVVIDESALTMTTARPIGRFKDVLLRASTH
jgi:hypothetical protein